MKKIDKIVLAIAILSIIISAFLVININNIKKNQEKELIELKAKNEQLEKDKEELYNKYFYEKLQAEYWYYYNVTDAC